MGNRCQNAPKVGDTQLRSNYLVETDGGTG
jgi:hypothetical protein